MKTKKSAHKHIYSDFLCVAVEPKTTLLDCIRHRCLKSSQYRYDIRLAYQYRNANIPD